MKVFKSFFLSYIIYFLYPSFLYGQNNNPGCTDPNAINYNSSATLNDGSCLYSPTNYLTENLASLNDTIKESSGLVFWNNYLWTMNDSGNPPFLFQLDTLSGMIQNKYFIKNQVNIDWEALTQSDDYFFIGDFGNSAGDRQNLKILRIKKNDILNNINDTITAETISFYYPEQTNFTSQNLNTVWDAEAFFYHNDSLHLFTKDWINQKTVHYAVPNQIGNFPANKVDSFSSNGLITDACIDNLGNIILLGNQISTEEGIQTFAWLLFDYQDNRIFSGNKRRIALGDVYEVGQMEGICFKEDYSGFISAEAFEISSLGINTPARLHKFDFKPYFTAPVPSSIKESKDIHQIIVTPNPSKKYINLQLPAKKELAIFNQQGKKVWESQLSPGSHQINCSTWSKGSYYLKGKDIKTIKFVLE
ncbi:MAG TPA: T9SS type A sorting domain-containing protein [Edaphocola sp.]|nr:T9SS type A sorting domain-containing protein [Edaphocola sp.]